MSGPSKRKSRPSAKRTAKYFLNDTESKDSDAELVKVIRSRWHGTKTRYRFILDAAPPHQLTVEWEGERAQGTKGFIAKYQRRRDAFLRDALPEGWRTLVVCPHTGTTAVIEGKEGANER